MSRWGIHKHCIGADRKFFRMTEETAKILIIIINDFTAFPNQPSDLLVVAFRIQNLLN